MKRIRLPVSARVLLSLVGVQWSASAAPAQNAFERAVPKVEASFEPAAAKPGDVTTLKLAIEVASGWHTYRTRQPLTRNASYVNKFTFPPLPDGLSFEGELNEPPPLVDPIKDDVSSYEGTTVWTRKARVSPQANGGARE